MNLPLNIDLQQILLHMFNFAILFAALYFLLYKPVKKFIDAREGEYKKASDEAKQKLKEADDAKAKLGDELSKMREDARRESSEMAQNAQKQYQKRISDAEEQAARIISDAEEQAAAIRRKALKDSGKDIAELVKESVGKVVMGGTDEAFEAFLSSVEKGGEDE